MRISDCLSDVCSSVLVLVAGYSAYPRRVNFATMREIADEVGATLMVDMAHFAGLVAGKVFTGDEDPVPHAHVTTTTTHKSLRGPRGGMVLAQPERSEEHTSELQSLMRTSYAVFCLKKKTTKKTNTDIVKSTHHKYILTSTRKINPQTTRTISERDHNNALN